MSKPARPVGRPSKYKPEYCEAIIEHMRDGASATSFAAEIGVDRSTIAEWTRVHPDFSLAFTRAKAACAAWWEKAGRKLAVTGEGSAPMVIFGLKNMGDGEWHDRQQLEHSGPDGGPLQVQTIQRVIIDPASEQPED